MPTRHTKAKTPRAPKPPRVMTRAQIEREKALLEKGLDHSHVHFAVAERGETVSRQTVDAVIAGKFRNADVVRAFAELTRPKGVSTTAWIRTMFPPEEVDHVSTRAAS